MSTALSTQLPHLAALHNGHQLDPFLATAVVDAAKRHWGAKISRWTIAKLQWLGPFTVHLSVQDLSAVDTDDLLVLLPDISNLHFDKRQGHAIINSLISSQDWTWSLEQFKSLGKLAAFLTVEQLKNLPPEVFSDREVQKSMVANTAGRGREVKEVAKRIVEDMGDPSTWSGEDLTRIGKVASGLEVKDLEKIPKSSIRTAVADLSKADLSPRQRMVIAQKYREASSNRTSKRLSSRDIRELKSLSVGLGSNVFAEMSPDDVKESINVLAENAAELQPTQKREIVRQV
ncbi:hypothetical protein BSL78_13580 [Apostichopus japonicus]|uniref:Stereocilin LRR domain-containing protein n=1 Tax=Stichopus japonicus TaxID=307972 RepID=A0A2G8KNH4_STIJA|nr:hypothetical protein BSL78_13580 [Apostichopus japonicus]